MKHSVSKKIFLLVFMVFGLEGCLTTQFYVLSIPSTPEHSYKYNSKQIIGVEKVSVPEYLFKREIAIAKSNHQISLLPSATWAEDLDTGLTLRLISFLQKKFNQPNVYHYPWGTNKQPSHKVKVNISRFISQGKFVYLEASWEVENIHKNRTKSKLFSTKVPTDLTADSIVSSMDVAFSKLEEAIAKGLR